MVCSGDSNPGGLVLVWDDEHGPGSVLFIENPQVGHHIRAIQVEQLQIIGGGGSRLAGLGVVEFLIVLYIFGIQPLRNKFPLS